MTNRIGAKGRVVIPKAIRDQAQLYPGDEIEIRIQDHGIIITAQRHAGGLGGSFARSGMAARLLADRSTHRQP